MSQCPRCGMNAPTGTTACIRCGMFFQPHPTTPRPVATQGMNANNTWLHMLIFMFLAGFVKTVIFIATLPPKATEQILFEGLGTIIGSCLVAAVITGFAITLTVKRCAWYLSGPAFLVVFLAINVLASIGSKGLR